MSGYKFRHTLHRITGLQPRAAVSPGWQTPPNIYISKLEYTPLNTRGLNAIWQNKLADFKFQNETIAGSFSKTAAIFIELSEAGITWHPVGAKPDNRITTTLCGIVGTGDKYLYTCMQIWIYLQAPTGDGILNEPSISARIVPRYFVSDYHLTWN